MHSLFLFAVEQVRLEGRVRVSRVVHRRAPQEEDANEYKSEEEMQERFLDPKVLPRVVGCRVPAVVEGPAKEDNRS